VDDETTGGSHVDITGYGRVFDGDVGGPPRLRTRGAGGSMGWMGGEDETMVGSIEGGKLSKCMC
jgi:hypothetical protein